MRFTLRCEGTDHTVELDGDSLRMLDHDPDAEQILNAMGASTPFCLRAVDAWARYEPMPDDPRQLIAIADDSLLSDQGREQVRRQTEFTEGRMDRVAAKARAGRGEQWARYRERHLRAERFSAMVRLPGDLRRLWIERLLVDAERTWVDPGEGRDPPAIELLLLLACEQALASLGHRRERKLWWKALPPDARPAVLGDAPWAPGVTIVGVPVRWLRQRWLRGTTIVDGRLSLADGVSLDFDDAGAPVLRNG
jgi:hypothetical protein